MNRASSLTTEGRTLCAVTFDLDGLMFNTEDLYQVVGSQVLARRDCQLTDDLLDRMMGRKSQHALQIMIDWHQLDATPQELAEEGAEIFASLLPSRLAPMPGLLELLAALESAGIPKGIATSSGREFVETVLGQFNMAPRFDFILTAEDIEHGKPAPDVYLLAAENHGTQPYEMMVLEDSEIGCKSAVSAGTFAIAVPSGRSHEHSFPGAQYTADSLLDDRIYRCLALTPPT